MERDDDAMKTAAREVVESGLRAAMASESLESWRANPTRVRERCQGEVQDSYRDLGLELLDLGVLGINAVHRGEA